MARRTPRVIPLTPIAIEIRDKVRVEKEDMEILKRMGIAWANREWEKVKAYYG